MTEPIVVTVALTEAEKNLVLLALGAWMGIINDKDDPRAVRQHLLESTVKVANKLGCNYKV